MLWWKHSYDYKCLTYSWGQICIRAWKKHSSGFFRGKWQYYIYCTGWNLALEVRERSGRCYGDNGLKAQYCCISPGVSSISSSKWFEIGPCYVHLRRKKGLSQCSIVPNTKRWFSWWTLSMIWLQVNARTVFSFTAVTHQDRHPLAELPAPKRKIFLDNWVFPFLLLDCFVVSLPTPALSAGSCIPTNPPTL